MDINQLQKVIDALPERKFDTVICSKDSCIELCKELDIPYQDVTGQFSESIVSEYFFNIGLTLHISEFASGFFVMKAPTQTFGTRRPEFKLDKSHLDFGLTWYTRRW